VTKAVATILSLGAVGILSSIAQSDFRVRIIFASPQNAWKFAGNPLPSRDNEQRDKWLSASAEITGTLGSNIVLDCGAGGWWSYRCNKETCQVGVCRTTRIEGVESERVDLALKEPSRGLLALFRRERVGPETLAARAGGNPTDAVLLQVGKSVHFGPALSRVLEGRYCVRLSPLPDGPSLTASLDWDRAVDSEGIAEDPRLTPGIYTLEKGSPAANQSCKLEPDGGAAWVIVASQEDFERLNAEWKSTASKIAELEGAGVGAPVIATLRHAALASLADSLSPK
jgi:hypothetical protein